MNRLDRSLGILLLLRHGKVVSATELAKRFDVSQRTIYRDIEALSELGIPLYADMGREGGFRLMDGYFFPPVMFTVGEAISLLIGLASLRRLRAKPFAAELDNAEHKLLAAMPDHLRAALAQAQEIIGFEETPGDVLLHPEQTDEAFQETRDENMTLTIFLQAILEKRSVIMRYRSPYSGKSQEVTLLPRGLVWDRDRWYLVGAKLNGDENRLWRADRVLTIKADRTLTHGDAAFSVEALLDRKWLSAAMTGWITESPVTIKLTSLQAARLKSDWYYRHARFESLPNGEVLMTFGEDNREFVFGLLRWLGARAELLQPKEWREEFRKELEGMVEVYRE